MIFFAICEKYVVQNRLYLVDRMDLC